MTQATINVLDAICGAGKSTWAFQHMKDNSNKRWVYVSPYLSEVGGTEDRGEGDDLHYSKGRIQDVLPDMDFKYPTRSPSKKDSFLRLIDKGENVGITHSLFSQMGGEVLELLCNSDYNLMIDETLDFISIYEDLTEEDLSLFLASGIISVDETKRVSFNKAGYSKGVLKDLKELCDNGCLYLYTSDTSLGEKRTLMIQRINPQVINAFESTTILTYRWESSLMWAWMKLNNMEYQMIYPEGMRDSDEIRKSLRPLLNIVDIPWTLKKLQVDSRGMPIRTAFSKGWYKRNEDSLPTLKTAIEKALQKKMVKKGDPFWTTFIDYKPSITGKGYTKSKNVIVNGMSVEDRNPFIPKNMRASNEYANCSNCIYTCNVFMNPVLRTFLGKHEIPFNEDDYALSELIQFIFRGCIRQGEPMSVLVVSDRMRKLLSDWLYAH